MTNEEQHDHLSFDEKFESFAAEAEIIHTEARERIGNELRKAREEAGLTLRQLAEKTDIAFNHIGRIERGKYNVTLDTLSILTHALGKKVGLITND